MKLVQLIDAVNSALRYERYPENIDVVITTKLPYVTVGQLPCTDVKSVGMGFDWEAGQFRITPQEDLMCVKHDVPQAVIEYNGTYHCPKCERMLGKRKNIDIKFCSKCGQAVKWDDGYAEWLEAQKEDGVSDEI